MWQALQSAVQFATANWAVLLFLLTVAGLLFGRIVYGISPFYWIEEIKRKEEEYRAKVQQEDFKLRMVGRHLDLASALLDAYELEAAAAEYQKALQLDSMNVDAQLGMLKSEIFLSIRRKDYSSQVAEKRLKLIQAENPNDKHALLFLGNVYSGIDADRALGYYAAALAQDAKLAVAYNAIGLIYDQRCEFDKASENYEKAAALAAWNTDILANVAYHFARNKRYGEAIGRFELLLRLDGKLLWPYWSLSQAYRAVGNVRAAYEWQRELVRLLDDAEVTSHPLNRGQLLFHVGNEPLYIYDLAQVRCYSYYSMALTCHLLGFTEQAAAFVEKAHAAKADDEEPPRKLLRAHIDELAAEQSGLRESLANFTKQNLSSPKGS